MANINVINVSARNKFLILVKECSIFCSKSNYSCWIWIHFIGFFYPILYTIIELCPYNVWNARFILFHILRMKNLWFDNLWKYIANPYLPPFFCI